MKFLDADSEHAPVLAIGLGRCGDEKSTSLSALRWRAKAQGRDRV
jgi:hypothetical protein